MDQREEIRAYLKALLAQKGDNKPFTDDASLLISGRLASVDAVEIVVFLEDKFHVDFGEVGFDQALIDSVDAIESLVLTIKK